MLNFYYYLSSPNYFLLVVSSSSKVLDSISPPRPGEANLRVRLLLLKNILKIFRTTVTVTTQKLLTESKFIQKKRIKCLLPPGHLFPSGGSESSPLNSSSPSALLSVDRL